MQNTVIKTHVPVLAVCCLALCLAIGCNSAQPSPTATPPLPVAAPEPAPGSGKAPTVRLTPKDTVKATPVDCEQLKQESATLASRCFRLIADKAACTQFFSLTKEMQEGGCAEEGQSQL